MRQEREASESHVTGLLTEAWRTIVPPADDPERALPQLLLALTVVTGLVDAVSYLRLGHVFVANMTGNVVFLGFALAGASGVTAAASLIALGSFLAGALLGGLLGARTSEHRGHVLRAAAAAQLGLMALALILALTLSTPLGADARRG